jgi:hypothetical protein
MVAVGSEDVDELVEGDIEACSLRFNPSTLLWPLLQLLTLTGSGLSGLFEVMCNVGEVMMATLECDT